LALPLLPFTANGKKVSSSVFESLTSRKAWWGRPGVSPSFSVNWSFKTSFGPRGMGLVSGLLGSKLQYTEKNEIRISTTKQDVTWLESNYTTSYLSLLDPLSWQLWLFRPRRSIRQQRVNSTLGIVEIGLTCWTFGVRRLVIFFLVVRCGERRASTLTPSKRKRGQGRQALRHSAVTRLYQIICVTCMPAAGRSMCICAEPCALLFYKRL
jgi:hypothetical protein